MLASLAGSCMLLNQGLFYSIRMATRISVAETKMRVVLLSY